MSYAKLQKLVMVLIIPNKICTSFFEFSKTYLEQKLFDLFTYLFISFIVCFSLGVQGSIHSLFLVFSTIVTSEIGRGKVTTPPR